MYTSTKSHTTATFLQGALGAPVRHVDMSKPGQYPGEGKGLTHDPCSMDRVARGHATDVYSYNLRSIAYKIKMQL